MDNPGGKSRKRSYSNLEDINDNIDIPSVNDIYNNVIPWLEGKIVSETETEKYTEWFLSWNAMSAEVRVFSPGNQPVSFHGAILEIIRGEEYFSRIFQINIRDLIRKSIIHFLSWYSGGYRFNPDRKGTTKDLLTELLIFDFFVTSSTEFPQLYCKEKLLSSEELRTGFFLYLRSLRGNKKKSYYLTDGHIRIPLSLAPITKQEAIVALIDNLDLFTNFGVSGRDFLSIVNQNLIEVSRCFTLPGYYSRYIVTEGLSVTDAIYCVTNNIIFYRKLLPGNFPWIET